MNAHIDHDPTTNRFTTEVDGQRSVLSYRIAGDVMQIVHTAVPPAVAGRGIAGALVKAAMGLAQRGGLRVDPQCAYARSYLQRHPETPVQHA